MKSWTTANSISITRLLQGRSNVYLINNGNYKLLVDTGGQNRKRDLSGALAKLNITKLDYLILTHTHFDHAGNARMVHDNYNAKVVAHTTERHILESGVSAIPKGTNVFTKAGVAIGGRQFGQLSGFASCPVDIETDDNYTMPNMPYIRIIHTPGHTAGSQCVIINDEYALVGDTLFSMLIGRVYPPFADAEHLIKTSWQKLLQTGCHTFLPGHGKAIKREFLQKRYNARYG